ncbi:MAG: N-6 DNA methylase [Planctomycetaceae bacterium]|nr:N-6 DNA methylase [Planctomycetaceae bacterium]
MKSLGWDIDNSAGYAEQYREVVHEDRVKVAGQTKAPDYSFRIGGTRKFFVEAKKPAVDIKNNWEPAYQIRRYAWSAKLAASVLTDFEEFAVYDTRIQPKQFDKPSVGRREYLTYEEYIARWDFLYGTFSKDAVLRGEFDRYVESKKGRGAAPVDDVFLGEIEEWRKALAINLARRNEVLDEASLNFAVQRIIDRILFLRIAEDRGTETEGQLQSLLKGEGVYSRLVTLFDRADERYNSGLFHFSEDKGRNETPDTLTPTLKVDDRTLKVIINGLYYPQSPYEFTMVPAEILGSVYERFLGKVITLTGGHTARIVEKPEVRKAGGVYYTPAYIVEYIVRNTVGTLLDGKTPKDAAKIKILDPACGSGSFLIGVYQFLLDWYLKQYTSSDPAALAQQKNAPIRPAIIKPPQSPLEEPIIPGWALTIAERKRILLSHLHGVDLDAQAVEVTKLNLLLKCLEGETSQTLGRQGQLFRERALPDLGKNILCGNSLIGTDIIGTAAWEQMPQPERDRMNPFDYESAFTKICGKGRSGGFNVVIGNPPYGYMLTEAEQAYFRETYSHQDYQLDNYQLFIERCLSRYLTSQGLLGDDHPKPMAYEHHAEIVAAVRHPGVFVETSGAFRVPGLPKGYR